MRASLAGSILTCLLVAAAGGARAAQDVDFADDFTSPGLSPSKWDDVEEFQVVGNKLVRTAASETVVSRADLKDNAIGKSDTPRDIKFVAKSVDLGPDDPHLRTVTLRVERKEPAGPSEVIYGSVQAYHDENGDPKVRYLLGLPGGMPEEGFTSDLLGDLALVIDGDQASLTFGTGTAVTLTVSAADPNPVWLCRVEMEADLNLVGSPSVDTVKAKSDKTQWATM